MYHTYAQLAHDLYKLKKKFGDFSVTFPKNFGNFIEIPMNVKENSGKI